MLNWKETRIALSNYRNYVVSQSRRNLSLIGMRNSRLYRSLRGIILNPRGKGGRFVSGMPQLSFYMNNYGDFVDKGVRGTKDEDADASFKKFAFNKNKKMINLGAVESFLKKSGSNIPASKRKSLKFAVATSIHQKGIKRSLFFTKPYEKRSKFAVNQITEGSANDITNYLVKQLKEYYANKD